MYIVSLIGKEEEAASNWRCLLFIRDLLPMAAVKIAQPVIKLAKSEKVIK